MIEKYQYRVDDPKSFKHPDVKDFKRLNKVVLKEGATNAAVSQPKLFISKLTYLPL